MSRPGDAIAYREPPPGMLPAKCWCNTTYVHVPITEIRAGLTRSCKQPGCKRPTKETTR